MPQLHLPLENLPETVNRLVIAFSSGIDSCVLLHVLLQQQHNFSLVLWHINHGLQNNALEMQQMAYDLAAKYGLEIRVDQLNLDPESGNLEAVARHARYDLFANALTSEDALLTAHHMNDQAETLMLNLMRGSGSAGLRAIASLTTLGQGYLFRPLLNFQRDEIEKYASQHNLIWVEDPSNESFQYDRNYLRHEILPRIKQRWPAAIQQLHRVSEWQREQHQMLEELAQLDFQSCTRKHVFSTAPCLGISALTSLSVARQKNLIRYWVKTSHQQQPGFKKLQQLLKQVKAATDAMPVIQVSGYSLRCYDGLLFIVGDYQELDLLAQYDVPADKDLEIEALNVSVSREDILSRLKMMDRGQKLELHFRTERASTNASSSHRLKRLFQKHRVPPWLRNTTPQIYVDSVLTDLLLF
jgi:tRNA(Ile)-lysidine synthase